MKKQMLLALWLPLIAITIFTGCKKQVGGLDRYKKFIYNIKLEGNTFRVTENSFFGSYDAMKTSIIPRQLDSTDFLFHAERTVLEELNIYVKNFKGVGIYKLNNNSSPYPFGNYHNTHGTYHYRALTTGSNIYGLYPWVTSTIDTGYIKITQYTITTIEADFLFTCYNKYNNSRKTVEGYFYETK